MDELAEQLEQALSGRYVPAPQEGELRALVNLATDIGSLHVAAPDELVRRRLAARLEQLLERERDPWWMGLVAWLGAGPAPRPFAQRLAAGLAVLSIGGGAASAATGVTPLDAVSGIAEFTGSVVRNLDPRDSGGNNPSETPTPDGTPSGSPTPDGTAATGTPPPGTPNPDGTPLPNSTPTAPGSGTAAAGTPTVTTATPQTPGATETVTPDGATTPPAPTASPTEDDDFETETPDDGSDDNGGDTDRDDRTEPGDDRDLSDDDEGDDS